MEKNNCCVILAAGEGTRMKSQKPKAMAEVLFKPMIDWVITAVKQAGIDDICVVTGHKALSLESHLSEYDDECLKTVRQNERLGTGHAVMQASEFIKQHIGGNVVVLNGDSPFIDGETIMNAIKHHERKNYAITVITSRVDDPFGYGRIIRDSQGDIKEIIEEADADAETKRINEVNSGAYCFNAEMLLDLLSKIKNDNEKGEYYLTATISIAIDNGLRAGVYQAKNSDTILGANSRKQLASLNEIARKKIISHLYDTGVDIPCTDGVMIGPDVEIGTDTKILPGTILTGRVKIGDDCVIGPNSYAEDSTIGNGVRFNNAQIRSAEIHDNADIGPFVQIRPDSVINDNVHLGNFVEVKNSTIDDNTKVSHLTYVGDSDVGKNVNFGCGVVTVNYNGKEKNRTKIGDGAFIGCNTNLIAPVSVGENSYTAAGSTIDEDVPDNSLAIARERQTNKDGWVKEKQPYKRKV